TCSATKIDAITPTPWHRFLGNPPAAHKTFRQRLERAAIEPRESSACAGVKELFSTQMMTVSAQQLVQIGTANQPQGDPSGKPARLLTLGCKVNQYETQYVRELLFANGY